jgi:diadenosine tetraphosphate (Ap4A) HIT family hydrolase
MRPTVPPFDAPTWNSLIDGSTCPFCLGQEKARVIAALKSGPVVLLPDANFVGYCVLAFRRHAVELFDLTPKERADFMNDLAHIAKCMVDALGAAKVNYEILGNAVPNLHCHIFPRYPNDGYWGGPVWWRPSEKRRDLDPAVFEALAIKLGNAIGKKAAAT